MMMEVEVEEEVIEVDMAVVVGVEVVVVIEVVVVGGDTKHRPGVLHLLARRHWRTGICRSLFGTLHHPNLRVSAPWKRK